MFDKEKMESNLTDISFTDEDNKDTTFVIESEIQEVSPEEILIENVELQKDNQNTNLDIIAEKIKESDSDSFEESSSKDEEDEKEKKPEEKEDKGSCTD